MCFGFVGVIFFVFLFFFKFLGLRGDGIGKVEWQGFLGEGADFREVAEAAEEQEQSGRRK